MSYEYTEDTGCPVCGGECLVHFTSTPDGLEDIRFTRLECECPITQEEVDEIAFEKWLDVLDSHRMGD